ncbi:MAG TPA: FAD-binding oxidoreductase [Candidatus Kapabacteria bacterium]|nr:FAD-binding oxidoreductase [Candidatus Kapabacteria bacterium]
MIIKTTLLDIYPYTYDSSNLQGSADVVYIPESIEDLIDAIKLGFDEKYRIYFSGAGTGITGSRVPNGGIVISTEKLKNIIEFSNDYVIVEPGVTLSELNSFLETKGKFLPPNPTEMNASIGGNISTNASGSRTFKYGAIRNWVEEIEIILADGDIVRIKRSEFKATNNLLTFHTDNGLTYSFNTFDIGMPSVKNASGYFIKEDLDLIDLIIGSEGTLGAIKQIKLRVIDIPEKILGLVIFFDDSYHLRNFVEEVREHSQRNNLLDYRNIKEISARLIEYFDKSSLELLRSKYSQIPKKAVGGIWIEQEYSLSNEEQVLDSWNNIISKYTNYSENTWVALNDKEHQNLREFRHELPLQVYENLTQNSQKKVGLDTAVPDDKFPILFDYYLNAFSKLELKNVIFGHIGNSHLHANIFCQNEVEYRRALEVYEKVIDLSLQLNGTVSAEHGIGKLKKSYLIKMYGQQNIDKFKAIKAIFDPFNLLNVGAMFD